MFFCLLVVALFSAASAKNSYVVVAPKSFRPGIPLNISVNILKSATDVNVQASLVFKTTKQPLVSTSGQIRQGNPGILELQVPEDLKHGSYQLRVEGSGQGLQFTNETDLKFETKNVSIYIQTDKAVYKPGQTVNFRAFAVYPNLTMYSGLYDIDIFDPNTNKIKQWRGLRDPIGLVTNFMIMDTQPVLGDWKIKVNVHGHSEEKVFTVDHYVLPKFKVTVELPSFALTSDDTLTGKVKAIYTYGKPVNGTVSLKAYVDHWYRPYNYKGSEPSVTQTLNIDGEATFNIPLAHIKQIVKYFDRRSIVVEANVTESINKITLNGSSDVMFYSTAAKLKFLDSNPTTFKPGLPYTAYLKVSQQDDTPIMGIRQDVNVTTTVTYQLSGANPTPYPYYVAPTKNYQLAPHIFTVPDNGIVPIQVDIPPNATSISLQAHYAKNSAYLSLSKSYSPSNNYIQLFLKSNNLQAGAIASFEIKGTETISFAMYQILSRGSVVEAGGVTRNTFSVKITDKMAPNARIVVYYVRPDGEIVTDSISFDVDGAFVNKVSVDFDKTKAQPGDSISVMVKADAKSMVNLLAVDQSVLLLKSGNDITPSEVINELKSYDTISPVGDTFFGDIVPMAVGRKRMIWWPYPVFYGGLDAQGVFDNAGVTVMTDATVFHHFEPIRYYEKLPMMVDALAGAVMPQGALAPMAPMAGGAVGSGAGVTAMKTVDRVRTVFPETWLWTNTSVGADGSATIQTTVPDTITSWVASAFAVNSVSGFGVALSTAKVETFKPFFVSLNLPYSVVRGEELALQTNVFNYMSQDLEVLVTLEKSDDIRNIVVDSSGVTQYVSQQQMQTIKVPAGQAKSVFFPVVPAGLGRLPVTVKAQSVLAADAVRRQIVVEPEGVAKEYSNPILLDLKNTTTFTKTIPLSLPAGVVAGSQRVVVSAIGDLMGPTVNGLDKLLRMPTGCGEQTMLGLAPDVFVTNYLSATNQLSSDIESKALNYMEKGYQRELTFQHKDGSFSAFGDRDKSGSMWLSAFVTKTFHQAKKHIFVDDDTIKRALDWMISRQKGDGSFPEPGRVIHKDMQGGSASGMGLTAFVLISLLENQDLDGGIQQRIKGAITKASAYIEAQLPTTTDDYTLAISSYALTLAKRTSATNAFQKLNRDAIIKDGMKHWHKAQSTSSSTHWRPSHTQANPVDIEMSSYALLVHAFKNDFGGGLPIMKWLTTQRNSNGGFASTQDTVLGLQSLSDFAQMVYSSNFDIQATVKAGTFTHTFSINQANALVLQTVVLPTIPSAVSVSATGHGIALLDINLSFNVEQEIEEQSFDLVVTIEKETKEFLSLKTCAKWLQTGSSGMAVQEFGIPTEFEADLESIAKFNEIKKVETEDRKVILYFDEISTSPLCITMDVYRTGLVAKSQPAVVRIYDYYQPSNQVTQFYQSHLLQNTDICDVCEECECSKARRR